jgi:hypothetical protein
MIQVFKERVGLITSCIQKELFIHDTYGAGMPVRYKRPGMVHLDTNLVLVIARYSLIVSRIAKSTNQQINNSTNKRLNNSTLQQLIFFQIKMIQLTVTINL